MHHVPSGVRTPTRRARRRRAAALGHACPECRAPWALRAVVDERGLVVVCRHCAYERRLAVRPDLATS